MRPTLLLILVLINIDLSLSAEFEAAYESDSIVKAKYEDEDGEIGVVLGKNLMYPREALENGIKGDVILQFTLSKEGKIVDAIIIDSPDLILTKSCAEVLKVLDGKWVPASKNGEPIDKAYLIVFRHHIYMGSVPPSKKEAAARLFDRGKYEKALKLYNKEIESNPYDHVLYDCRSEVRAKLGDPEKAAEDALISKKLSDDIFSVIDITAIGIRRTTSGSYQSF